MREKIATYTVDPPKVTWVLVANSGEAAVFRREQGMPMEFLERWENPREDALDFARTLGRLMGKRRSQGRFSELVLVAEPHFLGMLRPHLPKSLSAVTEVPRELRFSDTQRVENALKEWRKKALAA